MGVKSKDIDFTVVLNDGDFPAKGTQVGEPDPFRIMEDELKRRGFRIWQSNPKFLTIRAKFPNPSSLVAIKNEWAGLDADFVLARKERDYVDGRRPDKVEPGTLFDDLERRDFTMNAIAKDAQGNYIDPFDGQRDIAMGIISAVGDPADRLREDALRAVRALRFMVTKNMTVDPGLRWAMQTEAVLSSIRENIADERIKDELRKMLAKDTLKSLKLLGEFQHLTDAMFAGSVRLDATMKGAR
jgi:tRNA nucleotidyltransferase/poly(A) polymerase